MYSIGTVTYTWDSYKETEPLACFLNFKEHSISFKSNFVLRKNNTLILKIIKWPLVSDNIYKKRINASGSISLPTKHVVIEKTNLQSYYLL